MKLGMLQYGGLGINGYRLIWLKDCKFNKISTPWTGPMTDDELAKWLPEADLIQASVYWGYVKR